MREFFHHKIILTIFNLYIYFCEVLIVYKFSFFQQEIFYFIEFCFLFYIYTITDGVWVKYFVEGDSMMYRKSILGLLSFSCLCSCYFVYSKHSPVINVIYDAEKEIIQNREKFISLPAIELFLGHSLEGKQPPRIAFALSGGGDRAAASGLGFLKGAAYSKLLPCASYLSALSGSTWLVAAILTRLRCQGWRACDDAFFETFYRVTAERLSQQHITLAAYKNIKLTHPNMSFCNTWGLMFLRQLLGDIEHIEENKISQLYPLEASTLFPFPLFSAALDTEAQESWWNWLFSGDDNAKYHPEYMEVSPLFTWCDYLKKGMATNDFEVYGYLTTGNIDSKFYLPMSFFFGLFGSAYSVDDETIEAFLGSKSKRGKSREECYQQGDFFTELFDSIDTGRLLPIKLPRLGTPGETMVCMDGGYIANTDLYSLLKRNVDVIIVCDSSAGGCDGSHQELIKMKNYALKHKFKFPSLKNPTKIPGVNNGLVFYGQSSEIPSIIYFYNTVDVKTTQFSFTQELTHSLVSCMEDAIIAAMPTIKNVIQEKIK